MPKYDIKANEELFNEWRTLADSIQRLNGIVQNDVIAEYREIAEWESFAETAQEALNELIQKTKDYVNTCEAVDLDGKDNWVILASTDYTTIRIKLQELLTKEEAEAAGKEGCEFHEYKFHGVYTEKDIDQAENELDIPF